MKKKLLGKRIVTFVLALAVLFTTCVPPQEVKADTTLPTATNTTISKARALTFDSSIAENMSDSDNLRYYKFTLSGASELIVRGTRDYWYGGSFTVYDADQTALYSFTLGSSFSQSVYLTGGQYYLKLESANNVTFTVSKNGLKESFTETQTKNNDIISKASVIELKKKYKGVLAVNDSLDYFKFKVPAKGKINFSTLNSTDNAVKYLFYDKNLNLVYSFYLNAGKKATQPFTLAAGTYYLAVTQNTEGYAVGSYNFTIDYSASAPKKPTLSPLQNKSGKKLVVKWKKVSGISGYEVQYSTNKKFKSSVTKKNVASNKTSATYTNLKKNKTYYVRMRSYVKVDGKKVYSSWSAVKNIKIKK